jgi:uncharacterized membrane protein YcaP (DUF421 family)
VFELNTPWLELVARAVCVYAVLLVMVRLSGKRTVGQYTPFDLLVVLLLSEAVSEALSGGEESVTGGLLVAGVLILLDYLASLVSSRSQRAKAFLEGTPKLLGTDGALDLAALRREKVAVADVEKRLREHGSELHDVAKIFLETDGNISFVKKAKGSTGS